MRIKKLPVSPGVYIFKDKFEKVLYVGKATSLKDRVGTYFQSQKGYARPIETMIYKVYSIEIKKTDTVLEAYILEQKLIKDLQPKYNIEGKDNKSFCYAVVTKEEFPRFEILRKTDLDKISVIARITKQSRNNMTRLPLRLAPRNNKFSKIYGPYTSKRNIEIALKILRKIFPYHSAKQKTEKGCLDFQLGRCPGPYAGAISKADYRKNIRGIKMILEGKKKNLTMKMKKEMEKFSKNKEYEKATDLRNKIFALQHIQDIALITQNAKRITCLPDRQARNDGTILRIEAYDISNISGKFATGSMVVFDNSREDIEPNKNEYRKFKIKTVRGIDDIGAMEEILSRRFKNNWSKPNLIILDGGKGHLNMARRILRNYKLEIPLLAVAKGPNRKKLDLYSFGSVPNLPKNIIEQIRDEAHRFAISYHRKLRSKNILK